MQRLAFVIMTAAALTGLGMSVCQRIAVINCEYDFDDISTTLGLTEIEFDLDIAVTNPNEIDVIMDKMDVNLLVNEETVADGEPTFADTIPSGSTDILHITMTASYLDLAQTIIDAIKDGTASYKLVGEVYFNTEIGEHSFPVTITEGEI